MKKLKGRTMTEVRNLRCVVKVDNKVESIMEADEYTIFDHIRETLEAYEEDLDRVLITIGNKEKI